MRIRPSGYGTDPRQYIHRLPCTLTRHCCIRAEGVSDEYQSGGWFRSEGDENGSKMPIVNAVRDVPASKVEGAQVLIARCNSATPHCGTELESQASSSGCKRIAVGIPWQGGTRMRVAVDPGSRLAGVVHGADHSGSHAADRTGAPRRAGGQERLSRTGLYGRSGWSLRGATRRGAAGAASDRRARKGGARRGRGRG